MRRLISFVSGITFIVSLLVPAQTLLAEMIVEQGFIAPESESYVFDLKWGSLGSLNDEFSNPEGTAVDPSGNIWVADVGNHRVTKFDSNGNFLFSFGALGAGDGQFSSPHGIAADGSGNIWVADTSNNRVQKFDSDGNRLCQGGGLTQPHGLAVDKNTGNAFVANYGAHAIVKFSSTCGNIGGWGGLGSGDGQFRNPHDVAVDGSGDVYVADRGNHRVQKFDSVGNFITKWGMSGSGDSRFTASPHLSYPMGIEVDSCGDIYVIEEGNDRVQKFDSNGGFITMWGGLGAGDGQFNNPRGITVDGVGRVYTVDVSSHRIQRFSPSASHITHLFKGKWGTNGNANGQFRNPQDIAVDSVTGDVYVADRGNNRIQRFDSSGTFVLTWGVFGNASGQFNQPWGIAVDNAGDVYVADRSNHRIQKFDSSGTFLLGIGNGTTWTGVAPAPGAGSGNGSFSFPDDVTVDPATGDIYVTDRNNHRIQKFDSSGTFLMGIGNGTTWTSAGPIPVPASGNLNRWFNFPGGLVMDGLGNLFVSDTNNYRIQRFDSSGRFLAKWGSSGNTNGKFSLPRGISVDGSGDVFVADVGNHRIQKFTRDGRFISKWGSAGSGVGMLDGLFNSPGGVALDSTGDNIYVADTNNHRTQRFERFGFSFSSNPTSRVIVKKDVTTYTMELNGVGLNTLSNSVSFCILSGLPAGTTFNFAPTSLMPTSGGPVTSTLTLDTSGATLPGIYTIYVEAIGGGQTRVIPITLEVKGGLPKISNLRSSPDPFSPNSDNRRDTTTIKANLKVPLNWTIDIKSGACPGAATVKSFSGSGSTISQVWDGKDTGGTVVPDGNYCYAVTGTTPGGIIAVPASITGRVDTTKPVISAVSDSPDPFDHHLGQTTTISYSLSEDAKVTIKIFSGSTLKRRLLIKTDRLAGANSEVWDGKDDNGVLVPAGTYKYKITAIDAAKNRAQVKKGVVTAN